MHLNDFTEFMTSNHSLKVPETPPSKEARHAVANMAGRPPREMTLKHMMSQRGITRAQAKERLRIHDLILAAEIDRRHKNIAEAAAPSMSDILDAPRPNIQMARAMRWRNEMPR